jgi:hypothetical protein
LKVSMTPCILKLPKSLKKEPKDSRKLFRVVLNVSYNFLKLLAVVKVGGTSG